MHNLFKRQSIKTKLTLVIMLICSLLLVVISSVVLIAEIYATRTALNQELKILADSLAANSSQALVLGKYSEAESLLSSLQLQRNIHAAYLFDEHGTPVAEYLTQQDSRFVLDAIQSDFRDPRQPLRAQETSAHLLTSLNHFGYFAPVLFEGKAVGTLYLLSDLDSLYGRLSGVAFGIILSLFLLVFCAWLLAGWLQKPVSGPILQLADLMGNITRFKDYSIRAHKVSGDEIGTLVDGFNRMLDQIELHQADLAKHQKHLEQTVAKRTAELRAAVTQLEAARQQADAANEEKSHFLSRMTHELRTPLIGVLGMNELMLRTSLNEQQKILVDTVQSSGEDLLHLISDVLDFSRIEAGKLELLPGEVDLYRVVEDAVGLLSTQAREKGLILALDIPLEATWKVRADKTRVRQILMNLIGNAIKFTTSGSVTVRLRCSRKHDMNGIFIFEVADTGIGMDAEARRQIYDVFYQVDGTGTRSKSGAGLGLAIVKQLIELMNGELDLASTPGRGSCFRFSVQFPLVQKANFDLPAGLSEQRVLLCLDDEISAGLLKSRLEDLKFTVDRVETASDAVYQLSATKREGHPYAMLFLSRAVCLPDGRPLYRALRHAADLHPLRTVLLLSDRGDVVQITGSEARFYTPVTWSGLYDVLCRSWQDLYLVVRSPETHDSAEQGAPEKKIKVLFVGKHVASRELFRLALGKWSVSLDVVETVHEIQQRIAVNSYAAVFLDHPHFSNEEMFSFLRNRNQEFPNCVLLCDRTPSAMWAETVDLCLMKPISDEKVAKMLQPLLAGRISGLESEGAC